MQRKEIRQWKARIHQTGAAPTSEAGSEGRVVLGAFFDGHITREVDTRIVDAALQWHPITV
jgi:hypothetical protein